MVATLDWTIDLSNPTDPKVIGAQPRGVFEQAALRAIRRWRYNPKIVDGVAVERTGIKVRIRFELGKG